VIRHAVKPGERLSAIAALHGVAADDIVTANPHKPTGGVYLATRHPKKAARA
jgi:LysM repeat protein